LKVEELSFEWDSGKERANRRKHRVGFPEATTVFGDPLSITISDPDHDNAEERLVTLGVSERRRLLVVVHTGKGKRIRLISARRATTHERHTYEESPL